MSYVWPAWGELAAHGLAVPRPLVLDLAALASMWNGNWDRDNVGAVRIDASKGSTLRSPFASKLEAEQPAVTPGAGQFTLSGSGRMYLAEHGTGLDLTIDTTDATLIITMMITIRVSASTINPILALSLATGFDVDGRMAWWSGWETVALTTDSGSGQAVDVSFARATVRVDVGAGSHYVAVFLDYLRGTAWQASADVEIDEVEVLERCLIVEEVRR